MVILKETGKQIKENIRIRASQEIAVLEILKNSRFVLREVNLLKLTKFLENSFEDGVPVTMTFISPNGSFDVGSVNNFDNKSVNISSVGERRSPYDFPFSEMQKIYQVDFGTGAEGIFCMGKNHNSIYLRDY